jgi:hypothetical protein
VPLLLLIIYGMTMKFTEMFRTRCLNCSVPEKLTERIQPWRKATLRGLGVDLQVFMHPYLEQIRARGRFSRQATERNGALGVLCVLNASGVLYDGR